MSLFVPPELEATPRPHKHLTKLQQRMLYDSDSDSSLDLAFSSPSSSEGSEYSDIGSSRTASTSGTLRASVAIQRVLLSKDQRASYRKSTRKSLAPAWQQQEMLFTFPAAPPKKSPSSDDADGASRATPSSIDETIALSTPTTSVSSARAPKVSPRRGASSIGYRRTDPPSPTSHRPQKPLPPDLEAHADILKAQAQALIAEMQALQFDLERLDAKVDADEAIYKEAWSLVDSFYWSSFEFRS